MGGLYFALMQLEFLIPYRNFIQITEKILFIIILLVVVLKIIKVIISWSQSAYKLQKNHISFLATGQKILNAVIYFLAFVFILQVLGIPITPLIASLGVGGLAVGLALQPTLSNYFSGLYISADGFIQPNDFIDLNGNTNGYVVHIGWRNTVIKRWDNNLIKIPNSTLADSIVTNFNEPQPKMDFSVVLGVSYSANLDDVERICVDIAKTLQNDDRFGVVNHEPCVRYQSFGDSNIDLKVFMQSSSRSSHFQMKHEFIKAIKRSFDKEGIVIAFPTTSVEFLQQPVEFSVKNK